LIRRWVNIFHCIEIMNQAPSLLPSSAIRSLIRNRHLIWQLARRDVLARYRGSIIGIAWSFITPLMMLSIYTFFFTAIFKARWGGAVGTRGTFATAMFVGLIVYGLFSECASRAPQLILSNANYVKKIIFPLDVLSVSSILAALFHALISLLVYIGFMLVFVGSIPVTFAYFPLVFVPLLIVVLAVSWFLSALGVYLRDLGQTVALLLTVMMYTCPIFFPIDAVPEAFRKYIELNPLTLLIEQARAVLLWGQAPDFYALGMYTLKALFAACLAYAFFQKTRRGFADVL
jgi:lipopolysaccharide transport system permease protein